MFRAAPATPAISKTVRKMGMLLSSVFMLASIEEGCWQGTASDFFSLPNFICASLAWSKYRIAFRKV
jgi:hypothetical protein